MTGFGWAVTLAAAVAVAGSLWRTAGWLRLGLPVVPPSTRERAGALLASLGRSPLGKRAWRGAAAFLLDVLAQRRLWAREPIRWAAHLLLFVGFTGLCVLHALGDVVTVRLAAGYMSTVNPWFWLRDLLGGLVLLGFALGAVRRRAARGRLPAPRRRDPLFIILVLGIVVSGFALGAVKIMSAPAFERMLRDYASVTDDEAAALRVYWAAEYGVAFATPPGTADSATLAVGETVHQAACAACHARPQTALVSYSLSQALRDIAPALASWGAEAWLLRLHQLLCVLAIAYLPFGRAFHVVSAPVALLAGAGTAPPSDPNRHTRRALALDACVRCGLCDERCSVAPLASLLSNVFVLPATKLDALRAVARGPLDGGRANARLAEGSYACSDCGRCTVGCPVGLRLDDLWSAGAEALRRRGEPPAPEWVKATAAAEWADRLAAGAPAARSPLLRYTSLTVDRHTFSPCVQCQTCTNVCPVVAHSDRASGVDATPQKVMNLLRLGLADLALGSRMVWDCATCYQCQEHCPAGIRVTEVLYELRNRGYERLGGLPRPERAALHGHGAP
ncbi:MAG: 4Fe-4S dicluster domain-containing protein [Gemmatimonadales bacterium]|nr:4Fe-4S dicluster domain-containing protein [Gemmatimonadales bacterium]